LSSVVIKSTNRQVIVDAVKSYVARLRREHPEVKQIIWFGSWIKGLPTPGSDVDLCLILNSSDKPWRDRIPDYVPFGFPVGVDLFPFTQAEFDRLRQESPTWYAAIMAGQDM
jgi:predicted nucleotidyltransferase